jgi:hypothetical protein
VAKEFSQIWLHTTRFGNRTQKKKKNRNLLCSWVPSRAYLKKSGDLDFYFSSKSGEFGSFFFPMKNP